MHQPGIEPGAPAWQANFTTKPLMLVRCPRKFHIESKFHKHQILLKNTSNSINYQINGIFYEI